ncbi:MAG: hypothetical protein ACJ75S_01135 [Solirubrobacterales bacterium]
MPDESSVGFAGALACRGLPEWWLFDSPVEEVAGLAFPWPFALPCEWPFAIGFDFAFAFAGAAFPGCGDDSGREEGVGSAVAGSPAGSGAGAEGGCACTGGAFPVGS